MIVHPALRALRSDSASQRHAQQRLEAARDQWRSEGAAGNALAQLRAYGAGAQLKDCPDLAGIFAPGDAAMQLVGALVGAMTGALQEEPLGQVPFRHQYDEGHGVIQLAEEGRAALSLVMIESAPGDEASDPRRTVCFTDGERHEIVLAGAADARTVDLLSSVDGRADLRLGEMRLVPGACMSFAGAHRTKIIDRVERTLVFLRLGRSAVNPGPSREYRLGDGALVHEAAGDRGDSRAELAMALLSAMGRVDAAPSIAAIAQSDKGPSLRWQALRECLALDTGTGFVALCAVAASEQDPLAPPARQLRAQLIESYPQLATLGDAPCPA